MPGHRQRRRPADASVHVAGSPKIPRRAAPSFKGSFSARSRTRARSLVGLRGGAWRQVLVPGLACAHAGPTPSELPNRDALCAGWPIGEWPKEGPLRPPPRHAAEGSGTSVFGFPTSNCVILTSAEIRLLSLVGTPCRKVPLLASSASSALGFSISVPEYNILFHYVGWPELGRCRA